MKISFITDEVTQSFDEAVRFARQNGLAGLELRSVEDTAIDMLPAETLRTWRRRLDAEGLTVCGLAGSFYKCAPEPDAVEAELAKLERLCAAADILGCAFIRGFAFFAPEEGPLPAETLAPYFERPVRLLEQHGKTLLLEADPSVNTSNHAALARLVEAIGSPRVRAIFDPGNCLYDPLGETPYPDGYEAIRPFFAHVHIKDAVRAVPESYYEGALALGATKDQAVLKVLVPASKSGILAGVVLGVGRAMGETMAVSLVCGGMAVMPHSLITSMYTMTALIASEMGYAGELHRTMLIATGFVLLVFILLLTLSLNLLRRKKK